MEVSDLWKYDPEPAVSGVDCANADDSVWCPRWTDSGSVEA